MARIFCLEKVDTAMHRAITHSTFLAAVRIRILIRDGRKRVDSVDS